MNLSPEAYKRGQKAFLKYYFSTSAIILIAAIVYYAVVSTRIIPLIIAAPIILLYLVLIFVRIFVRKFIFSLVSQKLDAEAFLALVRARKFDNKASTYQLYAEYAIGNYSSVVAVCESKSKIPALSKRYGYYYLAYLANVYFDLGEDEKLREVCALFDERLSKEKQSRQDTLKKRHLRMSFYRMYLERRFDDCEKWLEAPTRTEHDRYHRIFCRARLAQLLGKTEEAKELFALLAKEIPQLNYGKLAARQLSEPDSPDTPTDTFDISQAPTELVSYGPSRARTVILRIVLCISAFAFCYITAGYVQQALDERKHERESAAYYEKVRVLLENDYDGVEIYDAFLLVDREQNPVDSLFICRTDTDILIGSLYSYEGSDETLYEIAATVPIASLSEDNVPLWQARLRAQTSDNYIECTIYKSKNEAPEACYAPIPLRIDGKTVYFVISDVVRDTMSIVPTE